MSLTTEEGEWRLVSAHVMSDLNLVLADDMQEDSKQMVHRILKIFNPALSL
jgi:hypothetical protein